MTKDEALKIALKTFEKIHEGCGHVIEDRISKTTTDLAEYVREDCIKGMDAIKEALAEQEHVSYSGNGTAGREADVRPTGFVFQMPPQRTWVGLTDEEIKSEAKYFCHGWYSQNPEKLVLLVKTIQAKLRDKNT